MREMACRPAPIDVFLDAPCPSEQETIESVVLGVLSEMDFPAEAFASSVVRTISLGRGDSPMLSRPHGIFEFDGRSLPRISAFGKPSASILAYAVAGLPVASRIMCAQAYGAMLRSAIQEKAPLAIRTGLTEIIMFVLAGMPSSMRRMLVEEDNVLSISGDRMAEIVAHICGAGFDVAYAGIRQMESVVARIAAMVRDGRDLELSLWAGSERASSWLKAFAKSPETFDRLRAGSVVSVPRLAVPAVVEALGESLPAGASIVGRMDPPWDVAMQVLS